MTYSDRQEMSYGRPQPASPCAANVNDCLENPPRSEDNTGYSRFEHLSFLLFKKGWVNTFGLIDNDSRLRRASLGSCYREQLCTNA